jgi:hypothetical protein
MEASMMSEEDKKHAKLLNEKRLEYLHAISDIDRQLREAALKASPPLPPAKRQWSCRCGQMFDFFLVRATHIDEHIGDSNHGEAEEFLDGRKVSRDTSIKGDPITKIKSKSDTTIVDYDELPD